MTQNVSDTAEYECDCSEEKRYRITFDGGDSGNYLVEYCQKCFDSDDKQFMISMEMMKNGF